MAEGQSLNNTVVNSESDNIETQNAPPNLHVSSRVPVLTEKGLQYQKEISKKNFKTCVSKWRRQSVKVSITMSDSSEVNTMRDERTNLESSFAELCSAFDRLSDLSADDSYVVSCSETFDKVEIEHQLIMCRISDKFRNFKRQTMTYGQCVRSKVINLIDLEGLIIR